MKRNVICIIMMTFLISIVGCAMKHEKSSSSDGDKRYEYFIAVEEGIKKDNTMLYRIVYEYDENGNEINKSAYDSNGNENPDLLCFSYDQQEVLEEYWTIIPDEENVTGYWRSYKDYDFVYDVQGKLVTWNLYDDNEVGLAKVIYKYESIPLQ